MQTSKYLLAAGVLAAVILPLQVQGGPDNDDQAKMRDALRRALEQPSAPQSKAPPAPAVQQAQPAPVTPVAPPPATPTVVVQTPQTFEPVPAPDDAASIARAREAMRQKLQEMQTPTAAPAVAPEPKPVVAVTPPPAAPKSEPTPAKPVAKPAPAPAPVATSSYKPIEAPASPFSPAKQAKLADLLAKYRADTITAQEYHAQRAAILAE